MTNGYIEKLKKCVLFASPLKRSVQTVDYVINTFSNIEFNVTYFDELMERGLGDFEGKSKTAIKSNAEYFINGKFIVTKMPPNGENLPDFRKRVNIAVEKIAAKFHTHDILVISHLQTLRMIKFCMTNIYDYETWHSINYIHGEVFKENYGE
jgi:broad specificity phosphatase PhoE